MRVTTTWFSSGNQFGGTNRKERERKEMRRKGKGRGNRKRKEKEGEGNEGKNHQVLPPIDNASTDGIQRTEKQSSSTRR